MTFPSFLRPRPGAWTLAGPLVLLSLLTGAASAQTATWVSTTAQAPWVTQPPVAAVPDTAPPAPTPGGADVVVSTRTTYQTITGFGGCFNELGWTALSALTPPQRLSVIRALFDPKTGCDFTLCRMPIGASDFARNWYSLDETPGDYALADFSIQRDQHCLIPYEKAALAVNPSLKIWGSAWSPPSWLKQNNNYTGGTNALKFEPAALRTYALYLAKYVQAYQAAGVPVYAVHVQNEPAAAQNFPSCVWTGPQERDFVRDYLGPQFQSGHVKAQIWLGTINDGNIADYADPVLSDPKAAAYISGVGYQWAGKDAIGPTHDKYPGYQLMQTETECGGGENNWDSATHTWGLLHHYLTHWANAYMYWNMVLDQNSVSSWGWKQNAMITVHTDTHAVTYNPEFYLMKHFSAFVAPGAKRVAVTGSDDTLAFRNPDGALIIETANLGAAPVPITLRLPGTRLSATLASQSFNTFIYRPQR